VLSEAATALRSHLLPFARRRRTGHCPPQLPALRAASQDRSLPTATACCRGVKCGLPAAPALRPWLHARPLATVDCCSASPAAPWRAHADGKFEREMRKCGWGDVDLPMGKRIRN
jgi:hypothetical protein